MAKLLRTAAILLAVTLLSVGLAVGRSANAAGPAYEAYHGQTGAYHQARHEVLKPLGYRLASLDVSGTSAAPRYAAVWVKKEGPPFVAYHGVPSSEFGAFRDKWHAKGYKPAIYERGPGGSNLTGVFEKTDTKVVLDSWSVTADVDKAVEDRRDQGFSPRWITSYEYDTERVVEAVFWKEAADPWVITASENSRFNADYANLTAAGMRPEMIVPSGSHRVALWRNNMVAGWTAYPDMTADQYQAAAITQKGYGARPARVAADGAGDGTRFGVVFEDGAGPRPREWSMTGSSATSLKPFDTYMRKLMKATGARSGQLAVARDGILKHARGYSWAEDAYGTTQPDDLFRIASCSKPLTAIRTMQLVERDEVSLGRSLQDILQIKRPDGSEPTTAFSDITVDHALTHSVGFGGEDVMFDDADVAEVHGHAPPVTKAEIASAMADRIMDFVPGTEEEYSNFGYSLLGQAITRLRGGNHYIAEVKDHVFGEIGVHRPQLGASLVGGRRPTEVLYEPRRPRVVPAVVGSPDPYLPWTYGGWNHQNLDAAGGWIAAAPDLVKVLGAFDRPTNPLFDDPDTVRTMWSVPRPESYPSTMRGWFKQKVRGEGRKLMTLYGHNGSLPGTSCLMARRNDGLSFAVLLNTETPGALQLKEHGAQLQLIADSIDAWPRGDFFPEYDIPSYLRSEA